MKARTAALIFSALLLSCTAFSGQQTEPERQIKSSPILPFPENRLHFNSFHEYSWVKLAGRKVNWRVSSGRFTAPLSEKFEPYLEATRHERDHEVDNIFETGFQVKLEDNAYFHAGAAFGEDIDFVYRSKADVEYGRRLVQNLFWNVNFKYLHYAENDVLIVSPRLVYYWGNHYLSGGYNASFTESRGSAQWGTMKGYWSLRENFGIWIGGAVGHRLYDIEVLDAGDQAGYIVFSGLNFQLTENLGFTAGYSYSREDPHFIKQSVEAGVSLKF